MGKVYNFMTIFDNSIQVIEVDGSNNLLFNYSGDTKIRMTAAGALDVEDDITAYSGI